jgi:hypothetical protein
MRPAVAASLRQTTRGLSAYAAVMTARLTPMTAEQRAQVCARLDELAAEVRELAREVAEFMPPSPTASARPRLPVAA